MSNFQQTGKAKRHILISSMVPKLISQCNADLDLLRQQALAAKTEFKNKAEVKAKTEGRVGDMFTGEVEVKPAGMSAKKFFSGKSYNKIKVDQDEFRRDCENAGFGWPPRTLKNSRWAK